MYKLQDIQGFDFYNFEDFKLLPLDRFDLHSFRVGIDKAILSDTRIKSLIDVLRQFDVKEKIADFASMFPQDYDLVVCADRYVSILNYDLEQIIKEELSLV